MSVCIVNDYAVVCLHGFQYIVNAVGGAGSTHLTILGGVAFMFMGLPVVSD